MQTHMKKINENKYIIQLNDINNNNNNNNIIIIIIIIINNTNNNNNITIT